MAKYRPVSPDAAWRDPQVAVLDIHSRYLEIYLLTSTFANVIGCYRLVSAIAAAETGMSCEEFQIAATKLEVNRIIERHADFYLVRRWFRHHLWESVLKGNVAKRAAQELALLPSCLQEKWVESCLEAGAPREFAEAICKPPSGHLEVAAEGLAHFNYNTTKPQEIQPDSTTTLRVANAYRLTLSSKVEPFRAFVEQSTARLDPDLAQQIADELSGILDAAEAGKRPPIGSLQRWLPAVIESAKSGQFVPQWGLPTARQRELHVEAEAKKKAEAVSAEEQKQSFDAEVKRAEQSLHDMSDDGLELLTARVSSDLQILSARARVMDVLKQRKVPRGPGCIEVLAAIKELSAGSR